MFLEAHFKAHEESTLSSYIADTILLTAISCL
jgi:hypothetical protein